MCILKTIYLAVISLIAGAALIYFTPANYIKPCGISSKNVKINISNREINFENGAINSYGKTYIREDILNTIDLDYEVKDCNKYIYIRKLHK